MFNVKNIQNDKKYFFNQLIDFNLSTKNLKEIQEEFYKFLKNININLQEIIKVTNQKNLIRGGFTKGIYLHYILIPEEKKEILIKYFFSSSNIYVGIVKIKNIIYHKFHSEKLIRDKLSHEDFQMFLEEIDSNNYQFIDEKYINNTCRIGKISHFPQETHKEVYLNLLKSKLIEEGQEVLKAYTYDNLIEEIGDVYSILLHIENLNLSY
jgi:hypothetical protein